MQELVNFLCFSRFDSCISFGTDFWRFIGVLPTPGRQCKLFTFSTRLTMPTFDGQFCFAPITTNKSMLWKPHLGNYTDVCRGPTTAPGGVWGTAACSATRCFSLAGSPQGQPQREPANEQYRPNGPCQKRARPDCLLMLILPKTSLWYTHICPRPLKARTIPCLEVNYGPE